MAINCRLKSNKNKAICKQHRFVNIDEYSKRELFDSFVYVPIFLILIFTLSWVGILPPENKTVLLWFTGVSAIASTIAFAISKFLYMNRRRR